ncbi:D-ornithine 4,5-aminomutase subunit beta [Clostridium tetanomorphum]|uniref:LuxR family transcriptional regulator n=1 Tax=Clostridium tetanomorphum TaxID=1553 RepID=A0A923EE49_CLOTT|nr:D-ornithine 4,5-aminomutase subunit OraE [Clostridium tetanomorphum]KAJ50279.1 methylmalonyl-CoA mutase C-terminal domain-containing protein [Clostridium tetanomorphum DSM 665]MBC2400006.1 LuxR family transcriptional regulator [Clostridium tetanomorphum]MBP1864554.1 D-ornithine 4,5-aminomutase subunit beta [Clostridium tetanomorphum]NRS82914.1 D-ornithine 4,5-aminomutase subunit beta [Clostridium tetanomorphum]NRZ98990.1 D-ornithine 4,5-aminomutase subunit beta [Clostridium tetanomorphum]
MAENLHEDRKLNVEEILKDLDKYEPKWRGWHWREPYEEGEMGEFTYKEISQPLKNSQPLPAARSFNGIDPQPLPVITTEIASGRFEDDLRRMRMAAWHGADHLMVIRTAGQSHFDGLIEGTPEGVGGVPITRKQVRATRKAIDLIEEEVGRKINFHSYVSGVAGPDIAVMFAEEGVNGAHQDPQYNVLYRNVNMFRSFVDAAVAKHIMSYVGMLQIDGAHNANATAMKGYNVMPELMVQHAINAKFSEMVGMKPENISLSTVPPTSAPAPCMRYDLPYAVALRQIFDKYKMRAQMNTKYIESCEREATVGHTLNLLISELTSADIQSTITPDEGRNVPWHYNNIHAVNTAKQAFIGMDGLKDMVELKKTGYLLDRVRELKERAVLFLEEIIEVGGYFKAVDEGFFVDSGYYPERNGDGIERKMDGGDAVGTIVKREDDYFAPVCAHFGYNNIPKEYERSCEAINECTLCNHSKIKYIDELDENDNVFKRIEKVREDGTVVPEVQWSKDGYVKVTLFLPENEQISEAAAIEMGKRMNLKDVEIIHKQIMQKAEGTLVEIKGVCDFDPVKRNELVLPKRRKVLPDSVMREYVREHPVKVVAATVGEDEHSVGLREVIDIKHGGVEKFGIEAIYLGTSCPVEKLVDASIESKAQAILCSTIITHNDVHIKNMQKLHDLCVEKGVRDKLMLISGGTQVTDEIAREHGMDVGFGRGSNGTDVASFIIKKLMGLNPNEEE